MNDFIELYLKGTLQYTEARGDNQMSCKTELIPVSILEISVHFSVSAVSVLAIKSCRYASINKSLIFTNQQYRYRQYRCIGRGQHRHISKNVVSNRPIPNVMIALPQKRNSSLFRGRAELSTFSTYEITSHKRGGGGSKKCRQSHNFCAAIFCVKMNVITRDGLPY